MTNYAVNVRKGRKWNTYYTLASSVQEARAKVEVRAKTLGYKIVSVENMDTTPQYTPMFTKE